jgi:Ca2+-binding EF-hand superfamily protein
LPFHSGFIDDNPSGTLSKEKMLGMYSSVLPGSKAVVFVEQIFAKFDTDKSGSIDFKVPLILPSLHEEKIER